MSIIDYHHHIVPEEVVRHLSIPEPGPAVWNPEESIEFLHKHNLKGAVLSLYYPGLPVHNASLWIDIARAYNEAAAAAKKTFPARFRAFAALPFPSMDASVSELRYALDTLQLDGVCIFPIAGEQQLDSDTYLPLLQELDRRQALVLLHPINAEGMPVDNEHYLDAVLAFTRFLYYDRFKECSNIRFMLAHTAGIIPYLADNMGILQYMQAEKRKMGKFLWDYLIKKRLAGDTLMKSMYIDTADCFENTSFQTQHSFFDAGHLLWGSDSLDMLKNLEILKKYPDVFQKTDLELFL